MMIMTLISNLCWIALLMMMMMMTICYVNPSGKLLIMAQESNVTLMTNVNFSIPEPLSLISSKVENYDDLKANDDKAAKSTSNNIFNDIKNWIKGPFRNWLRDNNVVFVIICLGMVILFSCLSLLCHLTCCRLI